MNRKREMKRSRAEAALPTSKAPAKALRRHKATTPTSAAENAWKDGGDDDKTPAAAAAAAAEMMQPPPSLPLAPAEEEEEEEEVAGWGDGAVELGEWWWCLWGGVEEEKLSGWFPFADEDFLCSDSRVGEGSGGLLWDEADHDIWQLQHIHEIPHTTAK